MDGDFAAGRAHRDPDITGRQSGCVIYAIANDGDVVSFRFDTANEFDFMLRQAFPF